MAWTTPRTWTAGETVTAALMNLHVRDNLDYLYANPTPAFRGASVTGTSYSLGVGAWTKCASLTTEVWDTNGDFDVVTNDRYTAAATEKVVVFGHLYLANAGVGLMGVAIYKNGGAMAFGQGYAADTGRDIGMFVGAMLSLVATDYLELFAYTNSSSGTRTASQPTLAIHRI